jgi:hypothetical protein
MNILQIESMSRSAGGAMHWSVWIHIEPVVTAIPTRRISPVISRRRIGKPFGKPTLFVDMAYSFLYNKQTGSLDRVIEDDVRIASLCRAVCLLSDIRSVFWRTP